LFFKRTMLALCLLAVCWIPVRAEVLPGDVDGSDKVNIADVTELIDYLLTHDASSIDMEAADVDCDGVVGIADVTALIDLILNAPLEYEHEWVDLGLPSGTLWATCNVGADSPEDYGDYFAWGETEPKEVYDWSTYKWGNGAENSLTKYCTYSFFGYNGFVDNKTELEPEDDAAYVNWGSSWRIPTFIQQDELAQKCSSTWTNLNGVDGFLFTGPNGNSLFLPAAGYKDGNSIIMNVVSGAYWSRTLNDFLKPYDRTAFMLQWSDYNGASAQGAFYRYYGMLVRAVRVSQN